MQDNIAEPKPLKEFRITGIDTSPEQKFKSGKPAFLRFYDTAITFDEKSIYDDLDDLTELWKEVTIDARFTFGKKDIGGVARRFNRRSENFDITFYCGGVESPVYLPFKDKESADEVYNYFTKWMWEI